MEMGTLCSTNCWDTRIYIRLDQKENRLYMDEISPFFGAVHSKHNACSDASPAPP